MTLTRVDNEAMCRRAVLLRAPPLLIDSEPIESAFVDGLETAFAHREERGNRLL